MRFVFDEEKAAEAAQYLVWANGGSMDFGVMLKVLYLADRLALVKTQRPITGDVLTAMENGTLLSNVYNRVKEDFQHPAWRNMQRNGRVYVSVRSEPKLYRLSRFEIEILDSMFAEHGHKTFSQMRALTHDLPEWTDPGKSSYAIDPEEILRSEGFTEGEIEEASAAVDDLNFLEALAG